MILKDKNILITGILTDKSIAYASAKIALEHGATVVATGFGKGLRITERAVKRLSEDIKVFEIFKEMVFIFNAKMIKNNFSLSYSF